MLKIAAWVCANHTVDHDPLTHLRLQRLLFYCYGALVSFDREADIEEGVVEFGKYGPFFPHVYDAYSKYGTQPIPPGAGYSFRPITHKILSSILNVYGRMRTFQLHEESYCEAAKLAVDRKLSAERLKAHFYDKFQGPVVEFPERLFGASSLRLSRVPVPTYSTLWEMSEATTRIFG